MTFSFKGASGSKPCGACANVFMKGFSKNKKTKKKILKAKGTRAIDITCFDRKGIVPNTNEAIWQYHDLLDTFKDKVSKAVFEKMEIALGTVYNPGSVVADKDLRALFRPLDALTFDWVQLLPVWHRPHGVVLPLKTMQGSQGYVSRARARHKNVDFPAPTRLTHAQPPPSVRREAR